MVGLTILLVRHAKAGSRHKWDGDDRDRPVSPAGRAQAEALVPLLEGYKARRVLSSPFVRCVQTVEPLAERLGIEVETRDELLEGADVEDTIGLLRELKGTTSVLCTHGDIVPAVLDELVREDGMRRRGPDRWPKASTWVLEFAKGRFMSGRYLPPPTR